MKTKLTTLMAILLLAVGWSSNASAQRLPAETKAKHFAFANFQKDVADISQFNGNSAPMVRAPKRAANDPRAKAKATHVYSWYASKTYDWVDGNGAIHRNVSITEPATNPYQIAHLLGSVYMNKEIPGAKYSSVWDVDVPYNNVGYGWDIPHNNRWNLDATAGTHYNDLQIALPNISFISSITVYNQNNTTLASWSASTAINNSQYGSYTSNGNTYYYYTFASQGWTYSDRMNVYSPSGTNNYYGYFTIGGSYISIPGSTFNGSTSIRVVINAMGYNGGESIYVNGEGKTLTTTATNYTWNITGTSDPTTVSVPDENGYTVFLVKVKDYNTSTSKPPQSTFTWNSDETSLYNFFNTYIDEVQLLTDGTRLNEDTEDSGTMFVYSGELNRFYFLGKGKNYLWGNYQTGITQFCEDACAPTYQMYEEFSPTTTADDQETSDFYSKLLYGNSYNVIHDCRAMCNFEHFFSMSGKNGTEHRSMTNLVFWIPDNRGAAEDRNYDEEYLPHVGLYTILLEAEAEPAADYSPDNRQYTVTCDWTSSLNSILDFPVDQDYELWIYTYDDNGDPVPVRKVTELIPDANGWIHNTTTHSYNVEQRDTSYVINYRVIGWPKDATNSYGHDPENGTFYAWSNIDPVLIPGYNNFLSVGVQHYESDFDINSEHNYYRNFLTLDNQNPNNQLTPKRIENGEDIFTLYRFDVAKPNQLTPAAELGLFNDGSKVEYLIDYKNQYYVDEANVIGDNGSVISGYTDPDALGYPTTGVLAILSQGGGTVPTTTYNDITIKPSSNAVNFTSIIVKSDENPQIISWTTSNGNTLPTGLTCSGTWTYSATYGGGYTSGTLTVDGSLLAGHTNVKVVINAFGDSGGTRTITVNGEPKTIQNESNNVAEYTWSISPSSGGTGFTLLNSFLDNTTYTQVGIVEFELPWKSISTKLQEGETATSAGYFFIQNDGKLRFVMPAGYNHANLKFVVHNAPVSSNYYDGTFTLSSSTGSTQTITIPSGGTSLDGDRDYEVIFTNISSGDVITITGTHTVGSNVYTYSPDFKYIHVYVQGGTDGISENDAINLAAIRFVDQFKAETKDDTHAYRYGYVLKYEPTDGVHTPQESAKPEVPVQHTGAILNGFYTFDQMIHDSIPTLLPVNIMNADVSLKLTTNPQVYYYTLDRKPSTDAQANWLEVSKVQKRENDTYQEMNNKMPDYPGTFDPVATPRYDTYNVTAGEYNDYMRYAPVVWTHGDQSENRRVKWNTEGQHNSYGAPIWNTGVGDVNVTGIRVERQDKNMQGDANPSTTWTDENNQECRLYFLGVDALGKLPTTNMKGEGGSNYYEPYMFRVWVRSKSGMLRGFTPIPEDSTNNVGSHLEYDSSVDHNMFVVYEEYTQEDVLNKTLPEEIEEEDWPDIIKFGALTSLKDNPNDLEVIVRFYYKVKHINPSDASDSGNETISSVTMRAPLREIASRSTSTVTFTAGTDQGQTTNQNADNVGKQNVGIYCSSAALGYSPYRIYAGTMTIMARNGGKITNVVINGSSNQYPVSRFSGTGYSYSGNTGTWTGNAGTVTLTASGQIRISSIVVTLESDDPATPDANTLIWDFEEQSDLNGWNLIDSDGDGYNWEWDNSGAISHSGTGVVMSASYDNTAGELTPDNWLISPEVTLGGTLSFWAVGQDADWAEEKFAVYVCVGSYNGTSSFVKISPDVTVTDIMTQYTYDLSQYSGTGYFAIRHYNVTNMFYLNIDDVMLTIPAVATPELTAPLDGSTVYVGTNTGSGVSVPVTISGNNLTQDLTINVSGTGFSVSPTTVTAAEANAGTTVTVTYNGTDPNATGTMTITSGEVSATVSLTASYSTSAVPELTSPVNGSTVDIGTNNGEGVSKVINVKGNNLTQALTVTITGEGFTGTRDLTISAADANAGTPVTVTYNGTNPNATGTMTVASNEVSATVNLTASYRELVDLTSEHVGYVAQDEKTPTQIFTGIIEMLYEVFHGEVVDVIYYNTLGMSSKTPFDGINIVVTRYSDGTTTTTKVVR